MLDIRFIRDNTQRVQEASRQKGYDIDVAHLVGLDDKRRELNTKIDQLRTRRNEIAASMKGGKPSQELVDEGRTLKDETSALEVKLQEVEAEWLPLLKRVPNMPTDDVPVGASEDENVISKVVGEVPSFDFEPRSHAEIAEAKDWLDVERAVRVAGSRFVYLKGDLVMLDWAMNMFALSRVTNPDFIGRLIKENNLDLPVAPFVPVQPPAVAKTDVYDATGRLNKEEQTYRLADDDLWLNASAEHVLAPMYLGEILEEADLPKRYIGHTTAFRREAGTYGKDTEGWLRLHQFNKLEMESFTIGDQSYDEHLLMIAIQEALMSELGIPYRVVTKCTADIGGPNARGVDIDAWVPSQGKYRETHTADLITDYQARRMNTRVRRASGALELVHTNDATALSQRPLIAILENFQTAEGDVIVPEVLRPYLGGREKL